ncbi:hypothetical protein HA051_16635 [Chromobacterium vaccinii]|nr:hypothetical protein [Chromobacterium vaccinii]
MSTYITIVIRMPTLRSTADYAAKGAILACMDKLKPYITAQSIEDEMTILETIENDPRFDPQIGKDARVLAAQLKTELKQEQATGTHISGLKANNGNAATESPIAHHPV